jgi:hypothetical protein
MARIRPDFGSATWYVLRGRCIRLDRLKVSVTDPLTFGTDPDPRIRTLTIAIFVHKHQALSNPSQCQADLQWCEGPFTVKRDLCFSFEKLLTSGSNFQEEFQSVSALEDQEVPQLQPLSCLKDQLPPLSCLKDQLPPLSSHSVDQFITSTSPTPEMSFFYSGVQQGPFLRNFFIFLIE